MKSTTCDHCESPIDQPHTGRRRRWCSEKCRKAARDATAAARVDLVALVGPAVTEMLEARNFTADDTRAPLAMLTQQVAATVDASPGSIAAVRELRQLLVALDALGDATTGGEVDERRVQFLKARITGGLRS